MCPPGAGNRANPGSELRSGVVQTRWRKIFCANYSFRHLIRQELFAPPARRSPRGEETRGDVEIYYINIGVAWRRPGRSDPGETGTLRSVSHPSTIPVSTGSREKRRIRSKIAKNPYGISRDRGSFGSKKVKSCVSCPNVVRPVSLAKAISDLPFPRREVKTCGYPGGETAPGQLSSRRRNMP